MARIQKAAPAVAPVANNVKPLVKSDGACNVNMKRADGSLAKIGTLWLSTENKTQKQLYDALVANPELINKLASLLVINFVDMNAEPTEGSELLFA
jgi:predicted short-subunit dehydrogenase-like oxidoreductase (DUF2520 family)